MKKKLIIVEQNALSIGGHYFAYTTCLANAAEAAGFDVKILANRRLPISEIDCSSLKVVPCFSLTWGEAENRGSTPLGPGTFADELDEALSFLRVSEQDFVLVHTCSYAELRSLLEYFLALVPQSFYPRFDIILRYDPELLISQLSDFSALFYSLSRSPFLKQKIRFWSDTKPLAEKFSAITGLSFGVCPIPFDQTYLMSENEAGEVFASPASNRPVTITYLGDARTEKGFVPLSQAVKEISEDYLFNGRVRFIIQSNFNLPGGEEGILEAVRCLKQIDKNIELIDVPLSAKQYYELLNATDIVVLPYSPKRYLYRSSGILIEAMAAGKVVVTSRGSWMESQVNCEHAVVFEKGTDLGRALAQAIDNISHLSAGAKRLQRQARMQSSPSFFIEHVFGGPSAQKPATSPIVFVIMDGGSIVLENGASKIFDSQINYLASAGYQIVALLHKQDIEPPTFEWQSQIAHRLRRHKFERIFFASTGVNQVNGLVRQRILSRSEKGEFSIAADIERSRSYDYSGELYLWLQSNKPDVVLLNYVTSYPILEALCLTDLPIICEMHDLQSFQKAIYGRQKINPSDLNFEFEMLKKCDALISLSEQETRIVLDLIPETNIVTTGAFFRIKQPNIDLLAGVTDCAELVASCGPRRQELSLDSCSAKKVHNDVLRLRQFAKSLDVLFVSSAHLANASGLRWFLDDVYAPFLKDVAINVLVVGSIDKLGPFEKFDRVVFVGQVDNLDPLYAAAKIVILPITEGAGIAVKTREAFAWSKPVVLTSLALRGFHKELYHLKSHEDPESFAKDILDLLSCSAKRVNRARASFEAARALGSRHHYTLQMDKIFTELLRDRAKKARIENNDREFFIEDITEWNEKVAFLNEVVRSWLEGQPINVEGIASLKDWEKAAKEILSVLLESRTAPVLRVGGVTSTSMLQSIPFANVADGLRMLNVVRSVGEVNDSNFVNSEVIICSQLEAFLFIDPVPIYAPSVSPPMSVGSRPKTSNVPWEIRADTREHKFVYCLLRLTNAFRQCRVSQKIPVDPDFMLNGYKVFGQWSFQKDEKNSYRAKIFPRRISDKHHTGRINSQLKKFAKKILSNESWKDLFDEKWYIEQYSDVAAVGVDPLHHFMRYGLKEGRNPNAWFDVAWYTKRYIGADISDYNPLKHYLERGALLGFDPSEWFSTLGYLDAHPDVRLAGVNPLIHYLFHGRFENRDLLPPKGAVGVQTVALPLIAGQRGISWFELEVYTQCSSPLATSIEIFLDDQKVTAVKEEKREETTFLLVGIEKIRCVGLHAIKVAVFTRPEAKRSVYLVGIQVGCTLQAPEA